MERTFENGVLVKVISKDHHQHGYIGIVVGYDREEYQGFPYEMYRVEGLVDEDGNLFANRPNQSNWFFQDEIEGYRHVFKKGQMVRCLDNEGYPNRLKVGNRYKVINVVMYNGHPYLELDFDEGLFRYDSVRFSIV